MEQQQVEEDCTNHNNNDHAAVNKPEDQPEVEDEQQYEEEEEEEFEDPLPHPTMRLTGEELEWALELKQQVIEDDELEQRTDFEYAMVTLICMDDIEESKHKLQSMQDFRREYNINDNALEGMELVLGFIQQQPWFLLDVDAKSPSDDVSAADDADNDNRQVVLVQDFSRLNPSVVKSESDWRIFMGGFYYLYQLLQPNLATIREGIICLGELDGVGWENFNLTLLNRHFNHLLDYYPMVIKETHFFHSSVIGNMVLSLLKKLRGEHNLSSPIQFGRTLDPEGGGEGQNGVSGGDGGGRKRLEQMFKTPTPEVAQVRLINKCAEYLTVRYKNQESYRLLPDEEELN